MVQKRPKEKHKNTIKKMWSRRACHRRKKVLEIPSGSSVKFPQVEVESLAIVLVVLQLLNTEEEIKQREQCRSVRTTSQSFGELTNHFIPID